MCFPSVMEGTRLYNHTGDIIHAYFHDCRGIRTCTVAATSPSIAKYGASTCTPNTVMFLFESSVLFYLHAV